MDTKRMCFPLLIAIICFHLQAVSAQTDRVLIIHGGAGTISSDHAAAKKVDMIASIRAGYEVLTTEDDPVAAVETAVRVMEDSPAFNAGTGSVETETGEIECDAIIINGTDLSVGAVGGVRHIKNPISLAKLVKDTTNHCFLVGYYAEEFALNNGVTLVPTSELKEDFTKTNNLNSVPRNTLTNRRARDTSHGVGTVGAVAINSKGQIATATSTGGTSGKLNGRVGDSPIVGGGSLADDEICGISATGWGEGFIRFRVASRIASLIEQGRNATEAVVEVLNKMAEKLPGGDGGAIVITKDSELGFEWNSEQMAWAYTRGVDIHYGVDRGEDLTAPLIPKYSTSNNKIPGLRI